MHKTAAVPGIPGTAAVFLFVLISVVRRLAVLGVPGLDVGDLLLIEGVGLLREVVLQRSLAASTALPVYFAKRSTRLRAEGHWFLQ